MPLLLIILFNINTLLFNLYKNIIFYLEKDNNVSIVRLVLLDKNNNNFELNKNFIEWFVGFTDAEGNFSITLKENKNINICNSILRNLHNKKDNNNTISQYTNLTFQIGLHVANLDTLEYIKRELKCGNISISKNRCNYYVSDYQSIKNIIILIFDFFHLNSSKYSQYIVFKDVEELILINSVDHNKIVVINTISNNEFVYNNIFETSIIIKISKNKIISILDTGLVYKNYIIYIHINNIK